MLSHNKQIGYTCKVCKMNVRSREALKRHENLHTKKPGDKYECRYCLSYFPNIGAKVAHERASHSDAKDLFKCSVKTCRFVGSDAASLRSHINKFKHYTCE